jgi:hypothetical protein
VEKRERLIERLQLLVKYQKARQWAKQYDLLSSLMTRAEGKRDFIHRTQKAYARWGRTPLLAFTPYKVSLVQVDASQRVWFISGCSQVLEKGRAVNKLATVEAYWEGNDWYFSEVENLESVEGDDRCSGGSPNNTPHPASSQRIS